LEVANDHTTFDYIRKAHRQFTQPYKDPPSDRSMATARSVRAEDADSILFRKGFLPGRPRRKQNELARQILRRRELARIEFGHEP